MAKLFPVLSHSAVIAICGRGCDLLYDQQLPTRTCAMGNCRV
jgi:hypothetical protein